MFSAVMSAFFSICLTMSRPFGDFRLIAIDFLLTLNWRKYQGSSSGLPGRKRRPGSPRPGFSILTTSAPNQASTSVQVVPASNWVKSTTFTPCRKLSSWMLSLIARSSRECVGNSVPLPAPRRNAFPLSRSGLILCGHAADLRYAERLSTRRRAHEGGHAEEHTERPGGRRRADRGLDRTG